MTFVVTYKVDKTYSKEFQSGASKSLFIKGILLEFHANLDYAMFPRALYKWYSLCY